MFVLYKSFRQYTKSLEKTIAEMTADIETLRAGTKGDRTRQRLIQEINNLEEELKEQKAYIKGNKDKLAVKKADERCYEIKRALTILKRIRA